MEEEERLPTSNNLDTQCSQQCHRGQREESRNLRGSGERAKYDALKLVGTFKNQGLSVVEKGMKVKANKRHLLRIHTRAARTAAAGRQWMGIIFFLTPPPLSPLRTAEQRTCFSPHRMMVFPVSLSVVHRHFQGLPHFLLADCTYTRICFA